MTASGKIEPAISKKLAQEIRAIAKRAQNEEEVRIPVETALKPVLAQLGIATQPSYEQKLTTLQGTGYADAVYGFGVIEYERPGKIVTPTGRKEVVDQLSNYLASKARELSPSRPHEAAKKMLGIGLDGENVLYLRYASSANRARFFQPVSLETQLEFFKQKGIARGGFQIVGPMPVDEASVDWLLYSLQFFHRRALEPHALAEVFGPEANIASNTVGAFYQKLLTTKDRRVEMFFAQWDMIFGVIYGQELERGDDAAAGLARLYGITSKPDLKRLLFGVHTYYVLLMKMLAAELISLQEGSWFASFTADVESAGDAELKNKIEHLENGGLFKQFNIVNFLEGDFFRWHLDVWDADIAKNIRHIAIALQQFEPATATIDPDATRDLLKKLYQYLLPRRVRHDLGEYYTPDWLADRLIRQIGYDGNPDKRILDPSCGSGTFLALCIRKAFDYADRNLVRPDELVQKLLTNVVGFDLNPLAVIAARTNFLLSLGTLIRHVKQIEIPVYFCDSILTPTEFAHEGQMDFVASALHEGDGVKLEMPPNGRVWHVDTSQGRFAFPAAVIDREKIETICALLEESVFVGRTRAQFSEKLRSVLERHDETVGKLLGDVFDRISRLNADGKNGIWARFLKNQFAPVFIGKQKFDFVIGNPPWVNWQSLSDDYRDKTWKLWEKYGLFSLTGHAARLGGGKKDLAMLFVYACLDDYVKDSGRLGFIITQTLFKTKGAGDGFRRFQLGAGEWFKVFQVDDLSDFQPFEGATNRTAIVTFQKGRPTKYPVPYLYWRKKPKQSIGIDDDLDEALAKVSVKQWAAQHINPDEPNSPWLTARPKALNALRKAIGQSDYRAYAGSCTWANGVYWLEVIGKNNAGQAVVRNLSDVGKIEGIEQVDGVALEPDLLYPLVRGRDVGRWKAQSSALLLNVQDAKARRGYDEDWLKDKYPLTFGYLLKFEKLLRKRSGFKKYFCKEVGEGRKKRLEPFAPFYSLYNVGEYTLAPYKVCWPELSNDLRVGVAELSKRTQTKSRILVPDHTAIFIPLQNRDEAHYCCAALNSSIAGLIVASYVTLHPSPHVLEYVRLPKFDAKSKLHCHLAALSEKAHMLAAEETEPAQKKLEVLESEIDKAAAELWGITHAELGDIQTSLADLK